MQGTRKQFNLLTKRDYFNPHSLKGSNEPKKISSKSKLFIIFFADSSIPGISVIFFFKESSQVLSLSESLRTLSPSNCSSKGSLSSGVEVEVLAPRSANGSNSCADNKSAPTSFPFYLFLISSKPVGIPCLIAIFKGMFPHRTGGKPYLSLRTQLGVTTP